MTSCSGKANLYDYEQATSEVNQVTFQNQKGKTNTEDPLNLLHGRVPTALKSPSLERSMELNKLHP